MTHVDSANYTAIVVEKLSFYDHARVGLGGLGIYAAAEPKLGITAALRSDTREPWQIEVSATDRLFLIAGPADVVKLNPAAIRSTQPPDQFQEYLYNLFVTVEFVEEDLPWRLSPAPAPDAAMKPWIVLIVLPLTDGVAMTPETEGRAAVLRIQGEARAAMPDLSRSHLWAHAQRCDDEGSSRLLCPTPLQPNTRYLAAVVPAFREGREAGLGGEPGPRNFEPAWGAGEGDPLLLPALHVWQFRSAPLADFAELVERLHRVDDAQRDQLGLKAIRVAPCPRAREPAPPSPWEQVPGGVLVGTAVKLPLAATVDQQKWFREALATDGPASVVQTYDPLRDDPVAGPTAYGAELRGPASAEWFTALNETPALRAMAGVGAEALRRHQEEVTVALLQRAAELRAAQSEQRYVLVAATVGLSRVGRLTTLGDGDLLPAVRFVATTADLFEGPGKPLPRGTCSASLHRQLRSGSPAGRAVRRSLPAPDRAIASGAASLGRLVAAFGGDKSAGLQRLRTAALRGNAPAVAAIDVAATAVRGGLRPLLALRDELAGKQIGRVSGWQRFARFSAGLTLRVESTFTLDFPVSTWIRGIDPDLLVPGIGAFPEHGVALLTINASTIEAMLVGANDALAREIVWRDLPVPRGATLLRRFWEGGSDPDSGPVRGWRAPLGKNLTGKADLALVLRSPLLRMIPGLMVAMVPCLAGKPQTNGRKPAKFRGLLDAGTLYAGFELSAEAARGTSLLDGWFVELSQPPGAVVFGTDIDDATGDRTVGGALLTDLLAGAKTPSGLAKLLLRRPGRAYIHASWLL